MTYATMAASGRGKFVLFLQIAGFPYIFATDDLIPNAADAWYWAIGPAARYEGVKGWLRWGGLGLDEKGSFQDGTLTVGAIPFDIVDVGAGMTALIAAWKSRAFTLLTIDLAAGGTPANVDSTADFGATGKLWIGQEVMSYTGKNAVQFTGLTRGLYGTEDLDHDVNFDARPLPIVPSILDGVEVIAGRRANVYFAEVSGGVAGASTCIFRGHVGSDIFAGKGVWQLKIDHITSMLSRKVGSRLPKTTVYPGYYYTGAGISTVRVIEHDVTAGTDLECDVTVDEGRYYADYALGSYEWNDKADAAQLAAGFTRWVHLVYGYAETDKWRLRFDVIGAADHALTVKVRYGDPLYALGFDEGAYQMTANNAEAFLDAQNDPRLFVLQMAHWSTTDAEPNLWVEDASAFTAGLWITIGNSPFLGIKSTATGGAVDSITLTNSAFDRWLGVRPAIVIDDQDDMVAQHVFAFRGETIQTAFQKMLHLFPGQDEPRAWCVSGWTADDVDWTELDDALVGVQPELTRVYDAILESTGLDKIIVDRLGLLGICPRIIADGKVGFTRLRTPTTHEAEAVELDEEVWDIQQSANVVTQIEGAPLLNQVAIRHSRDYRDGKWSPDLTIGHDDGIGALGKTRTKSYECRGLVVSSNPSVIAYRTTMELAHAVKAVLFGSHFGLYGRVAPLIQIPCTWTAKQSSFYIGNIVEITHPCIIDVAEGTYGVTARYGIVINKRPNISEQKGDILDVQLPASINAGPISPCALTTGWNPGALTLAVAVTNLYAQAGATDLTEFVAGMDVSFTEYDATAPGTWGPTKIDSVGANSIVLILDPFGGAYPAAGVWVHWPDHANSNADQRLWLFLGDAAYGLGAAPDPAYEWAL